MAKIFLSLTSVNTFPTNLAAISVSISGTTYCISPSYTRRRATGDKQCELDAAERAAPVRQGIGPAADPGLPVASRIITVRDIVSREIPPVIAAAPNSE